MPSSRLTFFDCARCKGFGYLATDANAHVQCPACHGNPSMFAQLDELVLYWGRPVSETGTQERQMVKWMNMVINGILLLCGVAGVGVLAFAFYVFISDGNAIGDFFFEPQTLVAVFIATLFIDGFFYYRLDQQSSRKPNLQKLHESKWSQRRIRKILSPSFEKLKTLPHHAKIDISTQCTVEVQNAVDSSYTLTRKLGHHQITPLHFLGALCDTSTISLLLVRLGVSKESLFQRLGRAMVREGVQMGQSTSLGLETQRIFFYALEDARAKKRDSVSAIDLFEAILHHDELIAEVFYDLNVEEETLQSVTKWIDIQQELRDRYQRWKTKASKKPKGIMDRALTAKPAPLLDALAQDFTLIAREGGFFPMIGRGSEMEQVMRILRQTTGNVLLVGPSGAGKSTILEGVAELMASEDVPKELQDKRFVVLDPASLIANAEGVGAIEGRMYEVLNEVAGAGNILLGIEDVHHLLNMRSTTGSEDAGGILMNALSQGWLRVVATTTIEEYQQFIVSRAPFLRRFQIVQMKEMSREESIIVLEARSSSIEYTYKVFFTYAAVAACVDLAMQFMPDRHLPAKALDIMSEAAAYVQTTKGDGSLVERNDVARIVAEKTNVHITALTDDERQKLLNLEKIMHERVVGQEEAVNAIASALRRAREGLRDARRPISNLLFLGPTGVGKTETAKTIAEVYFGNEDNMIRVDMSEYQDPASIQKLIGGRGEQGYLTNAIRLKPFSIILLDEFEKAHPDVLNVFLQVMDDGRLTDGTGQTFDMRNCMIIATSNAGTQQIQNSVGAGLSIDRVKNQLMEETLPQYFKPELLNRFDNIVVFTPLTFEHVTLITQRMLKKIAEQMVRERGITLEVTPEAVADIAQRGYDPRYGARPLRRVMQETVNDGLAKLLLSEQVRRRDTIVLHAAGAMEVKEANRL